MKRTAISVTCAIVLVTIGITTTHSYPFSVQPTLAQEAETEAYTRTISVAGFGRASTAPDSVDVQLAISSDSMNFGPSGPQFQPFDEENLEIVETALVELGIAEESIHMNPFGRSDFGPGGSSGIARFSYDEPQKLNDFLNSLIEELDKNRGPNIQGTRAIFRVEDCEALESDAMKAAVDNAQIRAAEMANIIDGEIGPLRSIHEQGANASSGSGPSVSTSCTTLENSVHQMGFNPFASSGMTENSPTIVEVSIAVEATFEVN